MGLAVLRQGKARQNRILVTLPYITNKCHLPFMFKRDSVTIYILIVYYLIVNFLNENWTLNSWPVGTYTHSSRWQFAQASTWSQVWSDCLNYSFISAVYNSHRSSWGIWKICLFIAIQQVFTECRWYIYLPLHSPNFSLVWIGGWVAVGMKISQHGTN